MGRRDLKDEKSAVAELAKMLNISRAEGVAATISKKNGRKAAAAAAATAPTKTTVIKPTSGGDTKAQRQARRKMAKRKSNGATVCVTLKGGIDALTKGGPKQAAYRGKRSEDVRVQVAETARLYMQSAQEQADAAGLSTEGGDNSEHAQYILSQKVEAAALIRAPKLIGAHLSMLAGKTTQGTQKGAKVASSAPLSPPPFRSTDDKSAFESALVQESLLTGEAPASTPDALEQCRSSYYFALRNGDNDTTFPGAADVSAPSTVPGRCVMRCKGPSGTKATAILTTSKSATYLKSALMQTIRKEMYNVLATYFASQSYGICALYY